MSFADLPLKDRFSGRLEWDDLDAAYSRTLIRTARAEDLTGDGLAARLRPRKTGDPTTDSLFPVKQPAHATLVAREDLVLCGLPLLGLVLKEYGDDWTIDLYTNESEECNAGDRIAGITGPAATLLQAERLLLNFLQRLSGIATHTRRYVSALGDSPTRLLDTRKTTPGWRMLEKYAVARGGAWNHRLGLFDRIMIKDNHLFGRSAQSSSPLTEAIQDAKKARPDLAVEVEVDSPDQIPAVVEAKPDVILLDNFSDRDLERSVARINGRAATEASGGITLERLPRLGGLGLDFISCGALVHQSTWKDIALDWREE